MTDRTISYLLYFRQRQQGQHKKNQSKRGLCRETEKLKVALAKEQAKKEKYNKRWSRLNDDSQSPHARFAILKHPVHLSTRRKQLLHASLVEELKQKYKNTRREREKQMPAKIILLKNTGYRG